MTGGSIFPSPIRSRGRSFSRSSEVYILWPNNFGKFTTNPQKSDSREAAFFHAGKGPIIFSNQLVNDITLFQFRRQDFPGVGFHFEMGAHAGICGEHVQCAEDMVGGIVKNFRGRAVQWDVEMNAPLGSGFLLFRLAEKRFAEVAINKALAVGAADDDLMKID